MSPYNASLIGGGAQRLRTFAICAASLGIGYIIYRYFLKKYARRPKQRSNNDESVGARILNGEIHHSYAESLSSQIGSHKSKVRRPSCGSERNAGSLPWRSSQRSCHTAVASESDLSMTFDKMQDIMRCMDRISSALELARNRSEKDNKRYELFFSICERISLIESDLRRLMDEASDRDGNLSPVNENYNSLLMSSVDCSMRTGTGTLSVLSDDSFYSAQDELSVDLEDSDIFAREPLNIPKSSLLLYQKGVSAALSGEVKVRKSRTEFCCCENDIDFMAKVWCLRQAFNKILCNERDRVWLTRVSRQLIADLFRHAGKEPLPFYQAYDTMVDFLEIQSNKETIENELRQRGIADVGFWDVVLDFILIDSLDDLSHPPSAVKAVTRNMYLSQSIKESTLKTVIWSMLRAKRARLQVKSGFVAHFYDISEVASPVITLGFLGTDDHMRELCYYFKEQVCSLATDIFNVTRVRFTTITELAEDVWFILRARTEMIITRFSNELIPANV